MLQILKKGKISKKKILLLKRSIIQPMEMISYAQNFDKFQNKKKYKKKHKQYIEGHKQEKKSNKQKHNNNNNREGKKAHVQGKNTICKQHNERMKTIA